MNSKRLAQFEPVSVYYRLVVKIINKLPLAYYRLVVKIINKLRLAYYRLVKFIFGKTYEYLEKIEVNSKRLAQFEPVSVLPLSG